MAKADTDTFKDEVQEKYLKAGRRKGPAKPFRPQKPCQHEGCEGWAWAQGYCDNHYQKLKRLGIIKAKRIKDDPVARFHASYAVNEETGCWEWTGWIHPKGYGILSIGGKSKKIRAHRFSWELHCGPIPEGVFVCHMCDNRRCCNPTHLFLGDGSDNMRDMVAKGRHWSKQGQYRQKLTEPMASNIRVMFARGGCSMVLLAAIYGVDHSTIMSVVKWGAHPPSG